MAPTISEFLKLSKSQKSGYKKEELIDILESSQNDINDGNNIQTMVTCITNLTTEIKGLIKSFADHQESTRKQFDDFKQQLVKQNEIIAKQQLYLEQHDRKERECNLVILGVPEETEALDGATTDSDKLSKVWAAAGITCTIESSHHVGRVDNGKRHPILAKVLSKTDRDTAFDKGKGLKEHSNEIYKRIYVKKDQHPSVRQEWKRLTAVFDTEKKHPSNQTSNIVFNYKERKVH